MLRFNFFSLEDWEKIEKWQKKRFDVGYEVEEQVREIVHRVKEEGDEAVVEYTRRFDSPKIDISNLRIDPKRISDSVEDIPVHDLNIIKETIDRIRRFHEKQKESSWMHTEEGVVSGQLIRPVERVGLYVPGGKGGKTPLISTLIMSAVPAKVAGVKRIVVVSPPREDGTIHPYILATAHLLGIEEVYATGSAWAVAALAYGTKTIPKVDMIVGPGNIYVTVAKKILLGEIGIDMLAGPSEVVVLADESANPSWIASDLLSQAEHDILASSILISSSKSLLDEVEEVLKEKLKDLPKKDIAYRSLNDWGALIYVDALPKGIELVNLIAPEHLELCVEDPWSVLDKISSAGTVFLGQYTPEPVGDYFAGPNHILPTSGTARFSSGLCVKSFYKRINFLYTSFDFIKENGEKIARLARLEGLEAHARSVIERL